MLEESSLRWRILERSGLCALDFVLLKRGVGENIAEEAEAFVEVFGEEVQQALPEVSPTEVPSCAARKARRSSSSEAVMLVVPPSTRRLP